MPDAPDLRTAAQALSDSLDEVARGEYGIDDIKAERKALAAALAAEATEPPARRLVAGSPPPTPAPTRDDLVATILRVAPHINPYPFAEAILALLGAEPAPPLATATTAELVTGDAVGSLITLVLPVPPGTAVEVREAGRPSPLAPIVDEPPSGGGCGGRDLT